jgi:hypothetical protein
MPITRFSNQGGTLEEFYADLTAHRAYKVAGREMLQLLAMINRLFVDTQLWGMTSHAQLVIQPTDAWQPLRQLRVEATGKPGHYLFEYWQPAERTDERAACFYGTATSLAEAARYLVVAMRECGAWAENPELQRLLLEYQLG